MKTVTLANSRETAKAVVHHTMKRLSAGETNDSLGTDLYSAFFITVETNNQERKAHTTHDTKTSGQASCSTAPMSIPAITSRKEINFGFRR
jgi:hypothetical protein